MRDKTDYPEFSNIRSHMERTEARHSFAAGVLLADMLLLAGEMLHRALSPIVSIFRHADAKRAQARPQSQAKV